MTSRGIRNNNPGNIRITPHNVWVGTDEDGEDKSFVTFTAPEWGIRAMTIILRTYFKNYNLNTVSGIISRWAPPKENDTNSYAEAVADFIAVDPTDRIDLEDEDTLERIVRAIIKHENGSQPYSDETILDGLHAATRGTVI